MSNTDKAAVEKLHAVYGRMKEEIGQVIVGQQTVIEQLLMAMFCRGHALLVGRAGPGQDPAGVARWRRRST